MTPRASCDQVLTAYEGAKADVLKALDEYPCAGRVYTCTRGPRTYVKWQSCNHGTRCQRTFPLAASAAGTTSPKLLTIAVDGAMAPICTAERAWQEVRMGVIFPPPHAWRPPRSADAITALVWVPWRRSYPVCGDVRRSCGAQAAHKLIFLSNGAKANGNVAETLFPGAIQIPDFYHPMEHVAVIKNSVMCSSQALAGK